MAVLLGLLVALTYGAGDFFGGLSAKRGPVLVIVILSQLCGLPLLAVLVTAFGGDPTAKTFVLGAAAGAVGGVGLSCLYRGLGSGRMSVVAPTTAVFAAVVPVFWGLSQGERPGGVSLAGVVLAVLAVGLISRAPDAEDAIDPGANATSFLALAVIAGIAFGAVFVLLAETGDDVGFWPLLAGRTTSIVVLAVTAVASQVRLAMPQAGAFRTIAPAGVLDLAANALYLLAARRGLLALVAVLASLYPASTVVLARVALDERLTRVQLGGLGLAGVGVVLIAV